MSSATGYLRIGKPPAMPATVARETHVLPLPRKPLARERKQSRFQSIVLIVAYAVFLAYETRNAMVVWVG